MGVLACSREGCSSIMCDRYSHIYGYICNECFAELVSLGPGASVPGFLESTRAEDPDALKRAALLRFDAVFPLS